MTLPSQAIDDMKAALEFLRRKKTATFFLIAARDRKNAPWIVIGKSGRAEVSFRKARPVARKCKSLDAKKTATGEVWWTPGGNYIVYDSKETSVLKLETKLAVWSKVLKRHSDDDVARLGKKLAGFTVLSREEAEAKGIHASESDDESDLDEPRRRIDALLEQLGAAPFGSPVVPTNLVENAFQMGNMGNTTPLQIGERESVDDLVLDLTVHYGALGRSLARLTDEIERLEALQELIAEWELDFAQKRAGFDTLYDWALTDDYQEALASYNEGLKGLPALIEHVKTTQHEVERGIHTLEARVATEGEL